MTTCAYFDTLLIFLYIHFAKTLKKVYSTFVGEENQTVRLICIPKYSSTNLAVIVDIETLDTTTINFGTNT